MEWGGPIFSNFKIIAAIPLPEFERGHSGLSFPYSRIVVLFLIYFKLSNELAEDFQTIH